MTQASATPNALAGIRVIDFSRFLPAAYCSWIFADMGADVVRIEHPRELAKEAALFNASGETPEQAHLRRARATQTRNKRSVLLNPGNALARQAIHELIRGADILIEDYRPGVLAKMGYAYEDMARLNPRLIYVSVSFAGQTGPLSKRAGHDPLALSLSGALSRLHGAPTPSMPGLPVADTLAGAHATIATLVALQARHVTGKGQHVDVAMSDACLPLMMLTLARAPGGDPAQVAPPDGAWHPKGGVWRCADGRYLCTTDMEATYWRRFCEVIGRPEFIGKQHAKAEWPAMEQDLKAIFLTRTRDEWNTLLAAADTQAMPVYSLAEALDHPHNRARGMVVEQQLGDATITQIGTPFHLGDTPARAHQLAPRAGQHTEELLAEIGWQDRIDELQAAGAFEG
jgi:crotonobetainyl-CoA:carnitine CoA-transferase CaiB-like acyl-CoA transferase